MYVCVRLLIMSTDVDYVRVEKAVGAKVRMASLLSSDAGRNMVSYLSSCVLISLLWWTVTWSGGLKDTLPLRVILSECLVKATGNQDLH